MTLTLYPPLDINMAKLAVCVKDYMAPYNDPPPYFPLSPLIINWAILHAKQLQVNLTCDVYKWLAIYTNTWDGINSYPKWNAPLIMHMQSVIIQ